MEHYSHPRVITALYRNYQKRMRDALSDLPVNAGTADYLRIISNEPGITLIELARLLGVSAAAVAQVLASLEKDGYIMRKPDEKDRRIKRIFLDEKGKAIEEPLNAVFSDLIARSFRDLNAQENAKLEALLTKLLDAMRGENSTD